MDVPEGWRQSVLRDVARLEMGETLIAKDLTGDGLPVYSANRDPLPWGHTSLARKSYRRGTIVVGARGSLGFPRLPDHDIFTSTQTTIAVSPTESVCSAYLLAVLASVNYDEIGAKQAVPMLTLKQLGSVEIGIPPLAEQKKIAEILGSVDEAVQATQAVIDQTRKVKQRLLQQLLTRGIGHTRFKQTEIGEIPESWDVARVGDHCSLVTKGTTPKPEQQHAGSGEIPYLKVYNLNREGQVDFSIRPTFIDRAVHDAALRRSRAYPGDVLMNIVGPPLKQVAIVPNTYAEWNLNQAIAIFRCTDSLRSGYLHACLSSEHLFKWARVRAKQTSGQANLTLELCANFPIPLPSPSEQREIAERLSDLDSAISTQRDHSRRLARCKSGLMADLLSGRVRVKVSE